MMNELQGLKYDESGIQQFANELTNQQVDKLLNLLDSRKLKNPYKKIKEIQDSIPHFAQYSRADLIATQAVRQEYIIK